MNPTMNRLARSFNLLYTAQSCHFIIPHHRSQNTLVKFRTFRNPIITPLATTRVSHEHDPICPANFLQFRSHHLQASKRFLHGNPTNDDDGVPASAAAEAPKQRKILPRELLTDNVAVLTCESTAEGGVCDVHVVGTSHLAERSSREVEAIVRYLKPQLVYLELCETREYTLSQKYLEEEQTVRDMIKTWWMLGDVNAYMIIESWCMCKCAIKLGIVPGSEFRVAFEEANKYGGFVVLGDRRSEITDQRLSAKLSLWHEIKLTVKALYDGVFIPSTDVLRKKVDVLDPAAMTLENQQFIKKYPALAEISIDERDRIMSYALQGFASRCSSVVAVVGQAHLDGIRKYWRQPMKKEDYDSLFEFLPKKQAGLTANNLKSSAFYACIQRFLSLSQIINLK